MSSNKVTPPNSSKRTLLIGEQVFIHKPLIAQPEPYRLVCNIVMQSAFHPTSLFKSEIEDHIAPKPAQSSFFHSDSLLLVPTPDLDIFLLWW